MLSGLSSEVCQDSVINRTHHYMMRMNLALTLQKGACFADSAHKYELEGGGGADIIIVFSRDLLSNLSHVRTN